MPLITARPAVRVIAVAVAAALLLTACAHSIPGTWSSKAPSSTPLPPSSDATAWADCGKEAEAVARRPIPGPVAQCGVVAVPADWARPSGKTFDIAMLRLPATGQHRIGSLLVNPGGPGASGVELAAYAAVAFPAEVRNHFDIVGFDPRGVGRSTQISCISDADKDAMTAAVPDPVEQSTFDAEVARATAVGAGCARKSGDALGLFNTEQAARDMDAVRRAVGDEKTTYLGFSYGTLLGAVYAELFPTRVRALVLDGAVDPQQGEVPASEAQAAAFEKAFDTFAADCRKRSCAIGPDARATVSALLKAKPVPGRGEEKRSATAGYTLLAVVAALYAQEEWPTLVTALSKLRNGDPTEVFQLADGYNERGPDGHYSNQIDANLAVNCADEATPAPVQQIRGLQSAWRAKYPLFGAALALSMLGCATWPAKHDPYPVGAAKGAPPILVVGTTGDPATPYASAGKLAAMLGNSTLLTWDGEGHTAYPQTTCVRDAVNQYLISLTVPAAGKRCPRT